MSYEIKINGKKAEKKDSEKAWVAVDKLNRMILEAKSSGAIAPCGATFDIEGSMIEVNVKN